MLGHWALGKGAIALPTHSTIPYNALHLQGHPEGVMIGYWVLGIGFFDC